MRKKREKREGGIERGSKTDFKGFITWLIFPSSQIPKFHMYFPCETQHPHQATINVDLLAAEKIS